MKRKTSFNLFVYICIFFFIVGCESKEQPCTIYGTVYAHNQPVSGAQVTLGFIEVYQSAITGLDGNYEMDYVPMYDGYDETIRVYYNGHEWLSKSVVMYRGKRVKCDFVLY
ncbi:MAG: carboxypeptidase regulatory-like domain-containing protein [Bacteroidales bacterium]|nr:carboxypeptidase regulatory-like domain-containing protein [Bacteroidales bacterium]